VFKALVAQPHGDAEGTGAVVAHDDDGLIGIEFLVGSGGDLAHGHQEGILEVGRVEFPGFTDIEKERGIGLEALFEEGLGSDFRVKHSSPA
jgi:hypothetical protein